jgi:predicted nucleotide-binding protein
MERIFRHNGMMAMDVSVEVGDALDAALNLVIEDRHAEVEPGHVLLGIAKRHSGEGNIDLLMSSFQNEFFRGTRMAEYPVSRLQPSMELCAVMAAAQCHADAGYLCTRDVLNGLAVIGDRKVAENAKRLLRNLPLTADIRNDSLKEKLREFLDDVERHWRRQVDYEILGWLSRNGAGSEGRGIELEHFLSSDFAHTTVSAASLSTAARRLADDDFILLADGGFRGTHALLTQRGEQRIRDHDGDDRRTRRAGEGNSATGRTVIPDTVVRKSADSRRRVFLVHGRDLAARDALIDLLRALDLKVIHWREAAAHAGGGTPYTGDIVAAGMELADAVVVLLTPDDIGYVRDDFRLESDGIHELKPTGQARLNVIFEAGMAMALDRNRVVLIEVGEVRKLSDTDGLNVIRLLDTIDCRKDLAQRLRSAGLSVDTEGEEWRTAGSFRRSSPPSETH